MFKVGDMERQMSVALTRRFIGAFVCLLSLLTLSSAAGARIARIVPGALKVEYDPHPLAVETLEPRLSWTVRAVRAADRALSQSAYQIRVASDEQKLKSGLADMWDSGKTASSETLHIAYAGAPLSSGKAYWWTVRVWDQEGNPSDWSEPGTWEMGLLKAADWKAKWIELSQPVKADHNGFKSTSASSADQHKWVMLDLLKQARFDTVSLFPAAPFDLDRPKPGYLFPLRFRIDVSDSASFDSYETVADQTASDFPNPGTKPASFHFPSRKARYVRLTVTKMAEAAPGKYAFALAEMSVQAKELALPFAVTEASASDTAEEGAWSLLNLNDNDPSSHKGNAGPANPAAMLRKAFRASAQAVRARLYVAALGWYEITINGKAVSDNVLAPGWTNINKRVAYHAIDVTESIQKGDNVLGATLADGWFSGRRAYTPGRRFLGPKPRFIAQLRIEFADGTERVIATDESWKGTADGPIRGADLFDGEVYDEHRELPGWNRPGFDDANWSSVSVVDVKAPLVSEYAEPVRVTEDVKPVAITEPKPRVYVVDLGQNIVGWVRASVHGPAGTTVQFRHAEMLDADGALYTDNIYHSILGAAATDKIVLRGDQRDSIFEPRFTYHGFRYVEVTGLPYKPTLDTLSGRVVHSAAPPAGTFVTSDDTINAIMRMVQWSQRGNMISVPTDCPQRAERLGWMGDAGVFAQTAMFNRNMARFYTKWLQDIRDEQTAEGEYSSVAPSPVPSLPLWPNSPGWADTAVTLPWSLYVNYGDTRVLQQQYESMARYIDSVRRKYPDLIWRARTFGDWLNGDTVEVDRWPRTGAATPLPVFDTAFFARSVELLANMAAVLGKEDDAKRYSELAQQVKARFAKEFLNADGTISAPPDAPDPEFSDRAGVGLTGDTQTAYGLALNFGLIPQELRRAAASRLVEKIKQYDWHLSTGIQGTNPVMLELANSGHTAEAYRLLQQRTVPSWGYMVEQGATTIWERWDGVVKGHGFQNPGMNSFNHYAFGAVGEWMYRNIGGINPDTAKPGYKHFAVRPRIGGQLNFAKTTYDSVRGPIVSDWRIQGNTLHFAVEVPANTTATIYVPATNVSGVQESGKPAQDAMGVKFILSEDGAAMYEVGSGRYEFESQLQQSTQD